MTAGRILLDTNILIYLAFHDAPFHSRVLARITSLEQMGHELCICPQVLREYFAVCTSAAPAGHGISAEEALPQMKFMRSRFCMLFEDKNCVRLLISLLAETGTRGKQVHDANLVALMLRHDIRLLLSNDLQDFVPFRNQIQVLTLSD